MGSFLYFFNPDYIFYQDYTLVQKLSKCIASNGKKKKKKRLTTNYGLADLPLKVASSSCSAFRVAVFTHM